ncbi:ion transporter [Saccharomonospora piscinae]|uniref:Ion transporter n=1 Tax=Saccharomonospora piscinae TaxID=687388 RepID=A0A1V9A6Z8_SACPI|nr:ion channel [Saccharomonospora piscinae]OQO92704.1 ion transporter [Saccharomonospora piscinae]TLW91586.1 ion transporter [Saccharomonospora piscinae]
MLFVLSRLLSRLAVVTSWATPVIVILGVFATSWPLMALAEPGNELTEPANYWWYFVVTASTVGYGDFYPESAAGHAVGVYVIIGGIVALTTVFTKLASVLEKVRGQRMQGTITIDESGHTVLLGYTPGRTERIVTELLSDGENRTLVLCAWDEVGSHPMSGEPVAFVRGDLTDTGVLRRAGVHRARTVLVDARDDNEALAVALAVDEVDEGAHVVVTLRDLERARLLNYVSDRVQPVQWHTTRMITEELQSPGISEVYAGLMTHGGANTYSLTLPRELGAVPAARCRTALARAHDATLLAARGDDGLVVNPGWRAELPAGAILYYVSERPLTPADVATALRQDGG